MPCLIAPLASLAPRGSRLGARLLRRRSQTIRRVCSFLLTAAGRDAVFDCSARSARSSSTTFETALGGRMIRGVTVTPWLALSAVGRCSSFAAAARPSRAGILAAESDALPVRSPSSSEESCQTPLRPAPGRCTRHRSVPRSNPCRLSSPARCPAIAIAPFTPIDLPDRTWPGKSIDQGAPLAVHRPAGRQPGADRPDDARPASTRCSICWCGMGYKEIEVGFPVRQPGRLRLRPAAHRGGPDPGRRADLGAHPGAGGPDRAHRPVAGRGQDGHHPHVQRHRAAVPPGGVPGRPARVHGARRRAAPSW